MGRLFRVALIVGGVLLHCQAARACRYNVRDVGFVDLGVGAHYLFAYVDGGKDKEIGGQVEDVLNLVLPETTIYAEIIDVNDMTGHPAMELLKRHEVKTYPAVVLVSPDERSRVITVEGAGEEFKKNLQKALEGVLDSAKRAEILKYMVKSYGVVLLVEGKDAEKNAAARAVVDVAVKTIEDNMDYLPKPIEKPPVVVTLSAKEAAGEEMMLWSLGIDAQKIEEPQVVILYGRFRQLGPVLTGEDLTEDIATNILSIIGADCECGLDRRWMQGAMVPVKWKEEQQVEVVKSLGFDPENPMVKMEMSMILRRGGGMSPGLYGDMNNLSDTPFGYQEIDVDFEDAGDGDLSEPNIVGRLEPVAEEVTKAETEIVSAPELEVVEPSDEVQTQETAEIAVDAEVSLKWLVLMVFGVCVAVIAVGVGILIRARR